MRNPNSVTAEELKNMSDAEWEAMQVAPAGQIWVCGACGRTGKNRMNINDESCLLNAVLCYEEQVDGVWKTVEDDDHQGEARDDAAGGPAPVGSRARRA